MSFTIITNSTTISATELNNNFYHIGQGDLLPMGGVSLTAETSQHDLGSSGNRWRSIYVNEIESTITVSAPMTFAGAASFGTITMSFPSGFAGYFPYFTAWEIYPTGTNAPAGTTGSYTQRVLNTSSSNLTGASLSSNIITLPAGTYEVEGWASGGLHETFKAQFYNNTDLTIAALGTSAIATRFGSTTHQAHSLMYGQFSILTASAFELQQRIAGTFIMGEGNTSGKGVFSCLHIVRIA